MEIKLAMLIMGSVLIILGVVKNIIPVKFNEGIFGKIEGEAENFAAAMRTNIGSILIGIGVILFVNRNALDTNESKALVFSVGVALSIFLLSIILAYFRKFTKDIPIPPLVILGSLIVIAFASSLGSKASNMKENFVDAIEVDPNHYKVEFENDYVRVIRIKYEPGEKSVMHDHNDGVAVFLNDQQAKFQFPNGETVNASSKAGQVMWSPAVKHLPENIGDETLELIQVEIRLWFIVK